MGPDRRVLTALYRHRTLDRRALERRSRLSEATLAVCLPKLSRIGWIAGGNDGYRLTARGRTQAKGLQRPS